MALDATQAENISVHTTDCPLFAGGNEVLARMAEISSLCWSRSKSFFLYFKGLLDPKERLLDLTTPVLPLKSVNVSSEVGWFHVMRKLKRLHRILWLVSLIEQHLRPQNVQPRASKALSVPPTRFVIFSEHVSSREKTNNFSFHCCWLSHVIIHLASTEPEGQVKPLASACSCSHQDGGLLQQDQNHQMRGKQKIHCDLSKAGRHVLVWPKGRIEYELTGTNWSKYVEKKLLRKHSWSRPCCCPFPLKLHQMNSGHNRKSHLHWLDYLRYAWSQKKSFLLELNWNSYGTDPFLIGCSHHQQYAVPSNVLNFHLSTELEYHIMFCCWRHISSVWHWNCACWHSSSGTRNPQLWMLQ